MKNTQIFGLLLALAMGSVALGNDIINVKPAILRKSILPGGVGEFDRSPAGQVIAGEGQAVTCEQAVQNVGVAYLDLSPEAASELALEECNQ